MSSQLHSTMHAPLKPSSCCNTQYASTSCRTFPGPPHVPHTLSIDFAPNPKADTETTAEDVVIAGIEVGGCLVTSSDGLWETRHGSIVHGTQRPQLCTDVHQVRPDPFDPNRYAVSKVATVVQPGNGCQSNRSSLLVVSQKRKEEKPLCH